MRYKKDRVMKKNINLFCMLIVLLGITFQGNANISQEKTITLGNKVPRAYFATYGWGESDVAVHTGSYDAALKMANIENCNIQTYSSVLPKGIKLVPRPHKLPHGVVLDTIIAVAAGKKGERVTAGVISWKLKEVRTGEEIGGFVAEYNGYGTEQAAKENLLDAMHGMNDRRGYTNDQYEIFDQQILVKSFIPNKKYGSVIVGFGFLAYEYPEY